VAHAIVRAAFHSCDLQAWRQKLLPLTQWPAPGIPADSCYSLDNPD